MQKYFLIKIQDWSKYYEYSMHFPPFTAYFTLWAVCSYRSFSFYIAICSAIFTAYAALRLLNLFPYDRAFNRKLYMCSAWFITFLLHIKKRSNVRINVASFLFDSACKPGSVVNGHLSLLCVTAKLQGTRLVPPADIRRANNPHTVLLRIGFTANLCYHRSG